MPTPQRFFPLLLLAGFSQAGIVADLRCYVEVSGRYPDGARVEPVSSFTWDSASGSDPAAISCATSAELPAVGYSLATQETVAVDYGYIDIYGESFLDPPSEPFYIGWLNENNALASFEDTLTLLNAPHGSRLQAVLVGSVYDGDASQTAWITVGSVSRLSNNINIHFIETFDVPYAPGDPIPISARIESRFASSDYMLFRENVWAHLKLDFQLVDAQGELISDYTYSTESGATYGLSGTTVHTPEPNTILLLIGGVLLCGAYHAASKHARLIAPKA